jgi:hypothetical protein
VKFPFSDGVFGKKKAPFGCFFRIVSPRAVGLALGETILKQSRPHGGSLSVLQQPALDAV